MFLDFNVEKDKEKSDFKILLFDEDKKKIKSPTDVFYESFEKEDNTQGDK